MHNYYFPMLAALACAFCNGTAAVLQKISADREKKVTSLDARFLWRLFQDKPYISGIILDIFGWLFTLFAVQYLPLFLVEAIIAANIVIAALIERIFRKQQLGTRSFSAIAFIVIGLVLLAVAASPEKAGPINSILKLLIVLAPVFIGVIGFALARSKEQRSATSLAILAGLAFGSTSVIGRIFKFSHPVWHTLYNPLVFGLIASGTLGILLFSIALQRAQATIINATMTASQTLIPAAIGIIFLGDSTRPGLVYAAFLGIVLTLGGVMFLTHSHGR